jgi:protein TonB
MHEAEPVNAWVGERTVGKMLTMRGDMTAATTEALPPPSSPRRAGAGMVSLSISLVLHGAALACVLVAREQAVGGGGTELEVVSVELVDGSALEARPVAVSQLTTASISASVAPADGQPMPEEVAAPVAPARSEPERAAPEPLDEIAPEVAPEQIAKPDERCDEVTTPDRETSVATPKPAHADAGGASATAETSTQQPPQPARAKANRGSVAAYARVVATELGRTKPKGTGAAGITRVAFTIGADGRIEEARIIQTSGVERLDGLALSAVRSARFPSPPEDFSHSERTFEVPYRFR